MKSSISAVEVLHELQRDCGGVVELRALPHRAQVFASLGDSRLEAFIAAYRATDNVYWGVSTRRDDSSGRTDNCHSLGALFADLDFSQHTEADLRSRLASFPLLPSAVIHSGGGIHPYWLLDLPAAIDRALEATPRGGRLKSFLRRVAARTNGDPRVAELARVLRVPGTFNLKRETPVLMHVEVFEPARRYSLDQLDAVLPADPYAAPPRIAWPVAAPIISGTPAVGRARGYLRGMGPAVEGQAGDVHTFKAAAWLTIDLGLDDAQALEVLSEWNATCLPPWTEAELAAKIQHARQYGRHAIGSANASRPARFSLVTVQVR